MYYFGYFQYHNTVTIDGHLFLIEVARTQQEQETGLAKYMSYSQKNAMYFPFPRPGYVAFWMKGMHFPIDILFIRNEKIVTIAANIPAPTPGQTHLPTYVPASPADGALEISAGLSQKYGFRIGDTVKLPQY